MISLRARIIRFVSKQFFKRVSADSDVHKVRARFAAIGKGLPAARRVQVQQSKIAGVNCEWLVPEGCENAPLIYYLHGGAFMVGSPRTHRKLLSHIARWAEMRALLPDYRLAPEYPFPAAIEDSIRVYRELVSRGQRADHMAIGGDSAGGNLAMATLLALRDAGEQLPAACLLLSPWLDLAGTGESLQTRAGSDPWFRPADMPGIASRYCADGERKNSLVSPVYADAHDLPPTLIQVGDREILLSDSMRLADNLESAGGDVTLQVWPEMWHVFQYFIGFMPESRIAIEFIARFLAEHMPAESQLSSQATSSS